MFRLYRREPRYAIKPLTFAIWKSKRNSWKNTTVFEIIGCMLGKTLHLLDTTVTTLAVVNHNLRNFLFFEHDSLFSVEVVPVLF